MEKRLKTFIRLIGIFMILVFMMALGCRSKGGGGSASPQGQSGTVTQGAVKDALVFADHTTGTEADFHLDGDEAGISTMTDDNGKFTLPEAPGYDYVLVSQDGTDMISGKTAMIMLAPAGAKNVTPLTTLVALEPGARAAVESLGVAYDTDLSTTATPAALLLVQSVQSIVAAATDVLNPALSADSNSLLISDVNNIQQTLMAEIAGRIQNQAASQLTDTTTLTAALQAAVRDALITISANYPTITISDPDQVALTIVPPIVDTVAKEVAASTGTAALNAAVAENAIITPASATNINLATDGVSSMAANQVTVKPVPSNPPTISGTPATTAFVGVPYRFAPTATGGDHAALLFHITNKPNWAKFNIGTGALTGTPSMKDVGTTRGIVISVRNGRYTAALPPFDLTVIVPTGSTGGTGGTGSF